MALDLMRAAGEAGDVDGIGSSLTFDNGVPAPWLADALRTRSMSRPQALPASGCRGAQLSIAMYQPVTYFQSASRYGIKSIEDTKTRRWKTRD
jgi:hypothetical protein